MPKRCSRESIEQRSLAPAECSAGPTDKDRRPETIRVDQASIVPVGGPVRPGPSGWRRRLGLLPPRDRSLESILEAQASDGTSIGLFRPARIEGLVIERAKPWTARQSAAVAQQDLALGPGSPRSMRELEQVPFTFSYRFTCVEAA